MCSFSGRVTHFNPRSPCGERPRPEVLPCRHSRFQSTLPVWGATAVEDLELIRPYISIHAPRVGSDSPFGHSPQRGKHFNPRSPCGERPAGTAAAGGNHPDFNPRSPCGERLVQDLNFALEQLEFQSTLPVWGATSRACKCGVGEQFQSTLPVWGATGSDSDILLHLIISIHAPRVGSDLSVPYPNHFVSNFNPRSPCGERLQRYTNFKVHLWRRGRIFASLREERRDSHRAAALRDRLYGEKRGANLPAFSVYYGFAVRESRCPPANSCSCSQNAPPSFRTGCPDSKTAASPFQHP